MSVRTYIRRGKRAASSSLEDIIEEEELQESEGISRNEEFSHEMSIESTRMDHEIVFGDTTNTNDSIRNSEVAWSYVRPKMQDKKVQIQFYCKMKLIAQIKEKLLDFGEDALKKFKKGPFRYLLKLPESVGMCPQGINYVISREMKFDDGIDETEISYFINNTRIRFGRSEFALITGLRFGKSKFDPNGQYEVEDKFLWHRIFGRKKVKVQDLLDRLLGVGKETLGDNPDDYVKAAKIVFVYDVLFGQDLKKTTVPEWIWVLVEFPHTWNNFPWGSASFQMLLKYLRGVKREPMGKDTETYHLFGFSYAFMAWIYSVFPNVGNICGVRMLDDDAIVPRILRFTYEKKQPKFTPDLIQEFVPLSPNDKESQSPYWKSLDDEGAAQFGMFFNVDRPGALCGSQNVDKLPSSEAQTSQPKDASQKNQDDPSSSRGHETHTGSHILRVDEEVMEKIGNYAAARALREVVEKVPGFTEYLKGQTTSNDMNDHNQSLHCVEDDSTLSNREKWGPTPQYTCTPGVTSVFHDPDLSEDQYPSKLQYKEVMRRSESVCLLSPFRPYECRGTDYAKFLRSPGLKRNVGIGFGVDVTFFKEIVDMKQPLHKHHIEAYFACLHIAPQFAGLASNAKVSFTSSSFLADVGVILDLQTSVGKIFKTCISMAVEDFYSNNTMIVPHFMDSSSDVVDAASAAIDLLKNTQVMAIFGPQRSTQAEFVIEIGSKVKVPIISPATSPSLSPQESPYFIRSAWSSSSQAKAVAAIVKKFGWREVVLVYEDNTFGNGLLQFLTEDLLESNALVSNMIAISDSAQNDQILEHLNKLKTMQTRVFVVHMLPPLASRFFKLARTTGMMKEGYAWIITEVLTSLLDSEDLETLEAMQGVVGVKAYIPRSSEVRNFTSRWKRRFYKENPEMERTELNAFGLWAYDSITALAEGVERVGVASPKFKKPANTGNVTDLEAIGTSNSGVLLVSLIKNFTSKGLSGDFKISNGELQPSVFEIVNVLGNGASRVGFWTQSDGISRRLNLGNDSNESLGAVVWPGQTSDTPRGWEVTANARKLRVGVPMKWRSSDLVSVTRDEETNEVNATGFCIDVFKEAMKLLPYHVEYEFVPFENAKPNSTGGYHYDSLIEQLLLKNFDAVVADVTISAKRSQMADFTISYIDSGISTVVPIEEKSKENAWNFMKPLTKGLWFTIAGFFIFTGFVVWALEYGVNEEFRGQPHKQVGMIFWFAFSTPVFAHKEKVKSNLSRFVVIIWLFVVLVLTSSYTANLTSMLTVQQLEATDFHDMSRKGEYIGFKESSLVRAVLDSTSSDNSKFRVLNTFEEYDEALSLGTRKGGVGAIIDNLPSIRLFLSKYCHKYTMIGKTYRNSGFGFPFQRGSPLGPDVSRTIMQMKENGKMDEISRKWFGEEEGCSLRNGTAENSKSLTVSHFKGLFFISGLSSFLAISIFLCMFMHKNRSVLTSDASLKQKLHELVKVFDQQRDDKLLPVSNKSRSDDQEMVAAEERRISSCYAEEGRWSTIELVVTRA